MFTVGLMTFTALLLSIDPEGLIQFVYGAGYPGVGYLVRWMCVAAVLYSLAVLLNIWAAALERTSLIFQSYLFASLFTVIASYPLTRYGGLDGVVGGTVLVEIIKVAVLVGPLMRWIRQ
jgi:O-antigen/teichoic acid export membrane protein